MGPLEIDLFASRLTRQLPRFYSWRPDPEAEATDAFLQDWAKVRGFANPPWCLIHRCLTKVKTEVARMVLVVPLWKTQSWFPVLLELLEDYPRVLPHQQDLRSSDAIRSGFSNATRSPNTDRLFHLRESFTSQGFSPEASDLMLASWRPKTNTNYGSCFARWADWCKQRDRDPLKGPISDIVNFLAELFSKGYQYQSLNAYRSAIASAHERIDGMSIGQHPAIIRVLKGAYQSRPPLPRYSSFSNLWDDILNLKIRVIPVLA